MSLFPLWRNRWLRIAILLMVPLALYLVLREQMSWRPRILKLAPASLNSLKFSPDGKILAASGVVNEQLEVGLWDTQNLTLLGTMKSMRSIDFAPDGKTFVGA